MRSHEIDYKIIGEDIQIVEIELDPNETVIAEAGTMLYMEDGIQFETKMGDGSQPSGGFLGKLMQVGSRLVTGESLFMTHFTNRGYGRAKVAFAAPYPGTVIPIDLAQLPGNALIAQRASFLCAALGTGIAMHFNRNLGSG
ncbi:MAG TPA: AIM24 family protein, partial [Cytophagales bacterium]